MHRIRSLRALAGQWLKRFVFIIGALNVAAAIGGSALWLWSRNGVPDHTILHLTLDGQLRERPAGPVASLAGRSQRDDLLNITAKLHEAATDKRVAGLLLEIKEPQVGPAQAQELARAVRLFAGHNKPTWSYLDTAGEGGAGDAAYALATSANTIMLAPCGEVSLFGLKADVPFIKSTLAKLQVDATVEQRYEYKSFADTFAQDGFTKAHKESLQSLLTDLQATYLALVGSHRGQDANSVRSWILGAPYDAAAAKEHKLVDHLGYREDMLAMLRAAAGVKEPLLALEDYPRTAKRHGKERIALVTGTGEIVRGEGSRTALGEADGMGSDTFVEALREAREDHVDGILLRLNTPGGSYLASDLIRHEIELARAQNIVVVVSMGDVAASGGYHVASAADHIVAEASSLTGSIGVVGVSFALRRTLDHFFGVHFGSIAVLPHPGTLNMLDPPDALDRAVLSKSIDRIYQDFVDKVAQGRHKTSAEVHEVAKGRVWTGQQALQLGLVDELGGYDVSLSWLRSTLHLPEDATLQLVAYPEPSSAFGLLRDAIGGQALLALSYGRHSAWLQPLQRALAATLRPLLATSPEALLTPHALPQP